MKKEKKYYSKYPSVMGHFLDVLACFKTFGDILGVFLGRTVGVL